MIVLFGATGMLGQAIIRAHQEASEPRVAMFIAPRHLNLLDEVALTEYFGRSFHDTSPRIVINAAGVIPLRNRPVREMIETNALAPHVIAAAAGRVAARVLHVSTDCVFSGTNADGYRVGDHPDATDAYGRTKALGESDRDNVVNVRTSFIGPTHGLVSWFFRHPENAVVRAYDSVMWNGSTDTAVAGALLRLADDPNTANVMHLAGPQCSKAVILRKLRHWRPDIELITCQEPVIFRVLRPTVTLSALWDDALRDVVERCPYSPLAADRDRRDIGALLSRLPLRDQRGSAEGLAT